MPAGPGIRQDIKRADAATVAAARVLPAATLHEAGGRIGIMPSAIKPVSPAFRVCGPAVTVHSPGGGILADFGFLVFARGLCIRDTGKDFGARGWINHPVLFDDLTVDAGDLIVGDTDDVVAVPRARAAEVVVAATAREAKEVAIIKRIEGGERTLEVYNF